MEPFSDVSHPDLVSPRRLPPTHPSSRHLLTDTMDCVIDQTWSWMCAGVRRVLNYDVLLLMNGECVPGRMIRWRRYVHQWC
ncbi:unnamed protein product [Arctogadus glacialis]